MLFKINNDIMEKWRWTSPRLYILIDIIKKYEDKLEKGNIAVFKIKDLMKDFGYTDERYIRHKSFINQIKSDITLLDPYKEVIEGRLVFEIVKTRNTLEEEVCFKYVKSEGKKVSSLEAEICDKDKTIQSFCSPKYRPFYGPIENDRNDRVVKGKTSTGTEIEIDLISLPENVRKQIKEEMNNG